MSGRLGSGGGATAAGPVAQQQPAGPAVARPQRRALSAALLAALLLSGGGCADRNPPALDGSGGDGTGAADGGVTPALCWGSFGCREGEPQVVRSCDPANVNVNVGAVVETCAGDAICSLGRCVSPACAAAQAGPNFSIAGCLFYTAALDNVDSDDAKPTLIVVTNPGPARATVSLEERPAGSSQQPDQANLADQAWTAAQAIGIDAGRAGSFSVVSQPIQGTGYATALARRVVSDLPVTVMVVQSDDLDLKATSSAGTLLLPVHALGMRYMAMTYQQNATPDLIDLAGALDGAGEIAIVATQDHTKLQIWAPGAQTESPPSESSLERDGDVYQVVSDAMGNNLSGTTIVADKPIAVFSGNVVTTYGQQQQGINSPDMAMEQMAPISQWSKTYVAARLPAQNTACDSLFTSDPNHAPIGYWQILASAPTDKLTFTAISPLEGLPTNPVSLVSGLPLPLWVSGPGDFVVHADVPILVTQGMDCEATLSSAVPVDAPLGPQTFALMPNFDHVLAIVRKDNGIVQPVFLDGEDITGRFQLTGLGFAVAHVPVPICYQSVDQCVHQLTGAHGMTLRGMDVACSYATTPLTWVQCLDTCP